MNLYAVDNDWSEGDDVHEELRDAWRALSQARDLWAIVDPARAAAIRAFQRREGDCLPSEVRIDHQDQRELLELLDGLEPALDKVLDQQQRLPAARLDEIAQIAPSLDLSPKRPEVERVYAAEEALSAVKMLRNFVKRAHQHGHLIIAS